MAQVRIPHTACYRGKKVKVILRDGTEIVDYFMDRTDRWIVLRETGRIMKSDLRAFIILKAENKKKE